MTAPARRPWWKKKRWAAALVVLLVLWYPVSEGPAEYARVRRWMPSAGPLGFVEWAYFRAYEPLDDAQRWVPGLWSFRWQWQQYWFDLAARHNHQERDNAASD